MGTYCPGVTIDRGSDRPVYRQLADLLRERITTGEYPPGSALPAEGALAQEHGIGRDTVRRAMHVLRSEGLIMTDHTGSHVRGGGDLTDLPVPDGRVITARMPTEPERRAHGISEGVPVLVVDDQIYPADRYRLTTG